MMRQVRAFDKWLPADVLTASRADCERFLAELYERSPNTAQMAWRGMRSFFAFVAEEDGSSNPMKLVKAVRVDEPATKVLTADEYQRLRYHLDRQAKRPGMANFTWKRDRSILGVLWDTGMRRGELAALNVDDVDLEAQRILVRKSKTGRPRVVFFTDDTARMLLNYLRARDRHAFGYRPELWLGAKGPLTNDGLRMLFRRLSNETDIDVTAHMFRRSMPQRLLMDGVSQTSVMAVGGWSSPAMPGRYFRSVATEVAEAEYRRATSKSDPLSGRQPE